MLAHCRMLSARHGMPTRSVSHKKKTERKRIATQKLKENPLYLIDREKPKPRKLDLKYPLQSLPSSTKPSGWLDPLGNTENLPFLIKRTLNKQLPVYSDIKNGGTRHLTVLRRYYGNTNELIQEIRRLVGDEYTVEEKLGKIVISGHHVTKIKYWLRKLGF